MQFNNPSLPASKGKVQPGPEPLVCLSLGGGDAHRHVASASSLTEEKRSGKSFISWCLKINLKEKRLPVMWSDRRCSK